MQRTVDEKTVTTDDDRMLPIRCSHCGGAIGKGRELIAGETLSLCATCYQTLVYPDDGGDVPSRWV